MARTKQWSRHSYPKKAIRRYSSDDEEDEDDSDDYNNDDNDNMMEIENDLQNETLEENKEDTQPNPPASADYLGPPRKPLNAFYFFKVDEFDATRAANPTLTMMEVIDVIGQKWGDLDESKKAEYQEKFEKHKNLYEESLKPRVWKPPVLPKKEPLASTTTGVNPNVTQMNSSDVKPAPPKRPLTPFFYYKADIFAQVKEENPEAKITELTKIISQRWNNIDQETKAAYEAKHNEAKEKYEQEIKEYEEKYGSTQKKKRATAKQASDESEEEEEDNEEEKERAKPTKSSLSKGDIPEPPRRPLSAFFMYKEENFSQVKKENPDAKIIELIKIISQKWMNIDQETKAAYETKQNEAKQRYEQERKEYEEKYGPIQKKKRAAAKQASDESEEEEDSEEEKERAKPAKSSLSKGDIPEPPRKPLSAFFMYKEENFYQVKKENPDARVTEITKIIAKKWANLDQETKTAYETKQNEAKEKYEQEIKEYREKCGSAQKKKRAATKHASDESEEDHSEEEEEKERAKPGKASLKKGKKA